MSMTEQEDESPLKTGDCEKTVERADLAGGEVESRRSRPYGMAS